MRSRKQRQHCARHSNERNAVQLVCCWLLEPCEYQETQDQRIRTRRFSDSKVSSISLHAFILKQNKDQNLLLQNMKNETVFRQLTTVTLSSSTAGWCHWFPPSAADTPPQTGFRSRGTWWGFVRTSRWSRRRRECYDWATNTNSL